MIPTVEETYTKITGYVINHKDVKKAMIEFAKLHVEAALKEASFISSKTDNPKYILNAYPLENIK